MPKVSFILPAYKRRFLREAIASILAQKTSSSDRSFRDTHSLSDSKISDCDFELVVVDDCSPEDLKAVVDEFHDERLSYHRNEKNIGGKDLVAAWTHAMEYARGEWCVLASDDDVYAPEYLEEMLRLAAKYPVVDLFHCRPNQIDAHGQVNLIGHGRMEFETCLQMMYHRLMFGYRQTMPDFMFRVRTWREVGGFVKFEDAMHSDTATWLKISQAHGVVCSPRILFSWRDSGANVSMRRDNTVKKVKAGLEFYQWLAIFLQTVVPTDKEDAVMLKLILKQIPEWRRRGVRSSMRRSTWKQWFATFAQCDLSNDVALRVVYDRFCKVVNPRNWF